MQKSTLVNLIVIIGLLILCVMTLTAIYATTSESSVLLLDESFSDLDQSKWKLEVAECTEDGNQFEYAAAEGFTADGILRVLPNVTYPEFRIKREAPSKCYSCPDSSLFSASLQTKSLFHASSGLIEVRAKFRKGDRLRFRISVISNDSESEDLKNSEEAAKEAAKATPNDFAQLEIIFESAFNRTILKSAVTDNDFHIYEIQWNSDGVTLSTDNQKVDEKAFELRHPERNLSNATAPVIQPFHLSVGVDFGVRPMENLTTHSEDSTSTEATNQEKRGFEEETILEVDYIRLFGIGSKNWIFK